MSPTLDGRTREGPRRNQGGVMVAEGSLPMSARVHDAEGVAPTLDSGDSPNRGGQQGPIIADTLTAPKPGHELVDGKRQDGSRSDRIPIVAAPLEASDGHHGYSSPRGDGADNLVPQEAVPIDHRNASRSSEERGLGTPGVGIGEEGDPSFPVSADGPPPAVAVPISGDAMRGEGEAKSPSADAEGKVRLRDPGLGVGEPGDPAFTVAAASPGAVGFHATQDPITGDEFTPALGRGNEAGTASIGVGVGASVRRLTPRECERLQALPDDWTLLEEKTPDSRRYSGLGDAVTASVGRWIGERIVAAERGEL